MCIPKFLLDAKIQDKTNEELEQKIKLLNQQNIDIYEKYVKELKKRLDLITYIEGCEWSTELEYIYRKLLEDDDE